MTATARHPFRWNHLSLRNKLTIVIISLLMLGIIIAGIGTMLLLRPALVNHVDTQLGSIAANPSSLIGGDPTTRQVTYHQISTAPEHLYYVAVLRADGSVLVDNWQRSPRVNAPDVSVTAEEARPAEEHEGQSYRIIDAHDGLGNSYRAIIVPEGTYPQVYGTLVIAMPLAGVNRTMGAFLAIFFGFGATVVVFGAALTRVLVSATLQPLRNVEATAGSFAAGDYSQRLPETMPNTEVGRLSRSLNAMLGRIDTALEERERTIEQMRRFVGDASHELRTPLVTVRGYAELYRMGALDEHEKISQAMDRIEKEALRMGGLVEDLLQLARLDETRKLVKDVIDLEPIAEDAAMDALAQAPHRRITALPVRIVSAKESAQARQLAGTGQTPGTQEAAAQENASAKEAPPRRAAASAEAAAGRRPGAEQPRPSPRGPAGLPASGGERVPAVRQSSRGSTRAPGGRRNWVRSLRASAALRARRTAGQQHPTMEILPGGEPPEIDVPAMIHGNEDKVRQAVSNIIGNALRYTPAESPLEIGVALDLGNRETAVEIIDHGEGIPEPIKQKIFQRFWRADTSRARETGGSGLGLAIVSAIMKAHDGTVEVRDTPGGGATFRLVFPLLIAEADEEEQAPGTADPA